MTLMKNSIYRNRSNNLEKLKKECVYLEVANPVVYLTVCVHYKNTGLGIHTLHTLHRVHHTSGYSYIIQGYMYTLYMATGQVVHKPGRTPGT